MLASSNIVFFGNRIKSCFAKIRPPTLLATMTAIAPPSLHKHHARSNCLQHPLVVVGVSPLNVIGSLLRRFKWANFERPTLHRILLNWPNKLRTIFHVTQYLEKTQTLFALVGGNVQCNNYVAITLMFLVHFYHQASAANAWDAPPFFFQERRQRRRSVARQCLLLWLVALWFNPIWPPFQVFGRRPLVKMQWLVVDPCEMREPCCTRIRRNSD